MLAGRRGEWARPGGSVAREEARRRESSRNKKRYGQSVGQYVLQLALFRGLKPQGSLYFVCEERGYVCDECECRSSVAKEGNAKESMLLALGNVLRVSCARAVKGSTRLLVCGEVSGCDIP